MKLTGDAGVAGHHLALVGQPLTVEIIQRAGNSGGGLCEVRASSHPVFFSFS